MVANLLTADCLHSLDLAMHTPSFSGGRTRMASPIMATLHRPYRKCQLDSLENLQALDNEPFDASEGLRAETSSKM